MLDDVYFMKAALEEAQKAAQEDEIPIGAIITLNDKIIATGHNQTEALTDITAHAEILAISSAQLSIGAKFLEECTIYVTIEPCTMCAGALKWSRIGRLVYGAKDDKFGYSNYSSEILHLQTDIKSGVLEDECRQIMQNFFRNKRRTH